MHFLEGIFFFLIITLLLSCYVSLPYTVLSGIKHLYKRRKIRKAGKSLEGFSFEWQRYKKILLYIFMFLFAFNLSLYLKQRGKWMGRDNANLTAKEYFVSGQVLLFYRSVLTRFLHPENSILYPLNKLQKTIYTVGSRYLPEDDGEIGIWLHGWMIYPYSKRFRIPRGFAAYTNDNKIAPMLVEFLDQVWFSIEIVATKPIVDKEMYEQHYLRNFPGMAHFYAYYERGYAPGNSGAHFYLSKRPKYIHRSELLIQWLEELEKRWEKSPKIQKFLRRHPEVEVMSQITRIMELGDIMTGRINSGDFSCNDPYWSTYYQVREQYAGEKNGKTALQRMHNQRKAKKFNYVAMQSTGAKFETYILRKYCGIILPGTIDWSFEERSKTRGQTLDDSIEYNCSSFSEEFKKLEEQFNGNQ